jgi:hypothetical protein
MHRRQAERLEQVEAAADPLGRDDVGGTGHVRAHIETGEHDVEHLPRSSGLRSGTRSVAAHVRRRITRAGLLPTTVNGGTSRVTTVPAATMLPVPIRLPGRIVTFAPIQTSSSITGATLG